MLGVVSIMKPLFVFFILVLLFGNCKPKHNPDELNDFSKLQLVEWNRKLTDVIVADIFTPPVASRIYTYPNVAAYEAVRHMDKSYKSLEGQLNELEDVPDPAEGMEYYFPLSEIAAFSTVAKELVYNREAIDELEQDYLKEIREIGIDDHIYGNSLSFGREVGKQILKWAQQDGYNERTALARYMVNKDPGRWQPTPPDYMEAIEPHWNTLRPFLLDSSSQFNAGAPTEFDTVPDSKFHDETMEVYKAVNNLDKEQLEIAKFWDCNPNISFTQGHVMYFQQQISPGGHWIHITLQVLEAENTDYVKSADVLTRVSVAIADAFISCWDEKYRSSLVRPETYINRYIDPDWEPVLQTPAFPEHTSGHSVASTAAATILTYMFGENYTFTDSTEVPFGLPPRHFDSFYAASNEAAISRLYGGIHYMPAIKKGIEQGRRVGEFAAANLNTRARSDDDKITSNEKY